MEKVTHRHSYTVNSGILPPVCRRCGEVSEYTCLPYSAPNTSLCISCCSMQGTRQSIERINITTHVSDTLYSPYVEAILSDGQILREY